MGCKIIIKCDHHKKRKQKPRLIASQIQIDQIIVKGEIMATQLPDNKKAVITLTPLDSKGNPTTLDGAATFVSSDASLLTVNPTGPLTAEAIPVGPLGSAQVQFSGDANVDPGIIETISGAIDLDITASQAVGFGTNVSIVDQ